MRKTIAVTARHDNAFFAARDSAGNFFALLTDYMYGTPERAKLTCLFVVGLTAFVALLSSAAHALQVCPA